MVSVVAEVQRSGVLIAAPAKMINRDLDLPLFRDLHKNSVASVVRQAKAGRDWRGSVITSVP